MARLNKPVRKSSTTHTYEGAVAKNVHPYQQLRRSVCSCMLWENEFYEDGVIIAKRIEELIPLVKPTLVADLALECRENFKLRHVPLLLVRELARISYKGTADILEKVIQRPDELTEFLAMYWAGKKTPLSAQVKKGLAKAFVKFDEYRLAKYNRNNAIKLRDVLFLCHAKPQSNEQAEIWKRLIDGTLAIPDTWEVALSSGKDKKATFERLIAERKLGALALLRNLRNMLEAKVSVNIIEEALNTMNVERVLPFRFITAARYAPRLEHALDLAMLMSASKLPKIEGKTALLVDHSGSMQSTLSDKSELTRFDAAGAVGIILRESCTDEFRVFTFSDTCIEVPPRHGLAMIDAIKHVIHPVGTMLGMAVKYVHQQFPDMERLVVITDEQSHDQPPNPQGYKGYVVNVAGARNGIGYGPWKHIDGFSEAVIDWIREYERVPELDETEW